MNQKDEIKKQQEKLKDLELQLDTQQHIFDTKYSDVHKRVQELRARYDILYELKEKIKSDIAEVLSDNVTRFVNGYSNDVKKEFYGAVKRIDSQEQRNFERMVQDVVWQKFHQFLKDAPELQSIKEDMDSIEKTQQEHTELAIGYKETEIVIHILIGEINGTKSFIKELSDIGKFRQHAKRVKEYEEEKKQKEIADESRKTYTEWFDANYIPKMKQTLRSSLRTDTVEGESYDDAKEKFG